MKPVGCSGCPLVGEGEGFLASPFLSSNGVVLVGDSLNDVAEGRSSFMLTRLLGWAGLDRSEFGLISATFCEPPITPTDSALAHCRATHWQSLLETARVVVPMGNVALRALTGRGGVLDTRGYVRPGPFQSHLVPTVSPNFVLRGQAKYASAFINDVRKAVQLAQTGLPNILTNYVLDPLPATALEWAKTYRAKLDQNPSTILAYDIETPYANDDESERGEDDSWTILRIAFSYEPYSALAVQWTPENMAAIRLLLGSPGIKADWNGANFDRPRVRHQGVQINGSMRDAMVAWHVLHSDLPKSLAFATTFTCPFQPEWKHLSSRLPAFYNAVDADVTLRGYLEIEQELRSIPGLWEAYERDVIRFDPVLRSMEDAGMPVNHETRLDRAQQLTTRLGEMEESIQALAPAELRTYSPAQGYIKPPAETDGLVEITVDVDVNRCSYCTLINPRKPHFKRFKRPTAAKPQNPCADAVVNTAIEPVVRQAALNRWSPSSQNLLKYQSSLGRLIPHKWDKREGRRKPSMDKKGIKKCQAKYPDDPLYALVLQFREAQKIAGTYIGYIETEELCPPS